MKLVDRIKTAISARSNFSLSYDSILTGDWGDLIPICCKEMVPTDKFTAQGQVFMRMAPLASPTFGRIHGFVNHFYVPTRILMPETQFEDSMDGGVDGEGTESFPFISFFLLFKIYNYILTEQGYEYAATYGKRFLKLLTYFGLGQLANHIYDCYDQLQDETMTLDEIKSFLGDDINHSVSMLPFAALARIYYDYYYPVGLEEDFVAQFVFTHKWNGFMNSVNPGVTLATLAHFFTATVTCYNKDYFTTEQTRPQRGGASIVPVELGTAVNSGLTNGNNPSSYTNIKAGLNANSTSITFNNSGLVEGTNNNIGQFKVQTMRWAENVQKFLERNNVPGGRFFEKFLARFGVKLPVAYLQRSSYIGGSDFWVNVSDVTQSNNTSTLSEQSPKGLGITAGKGVALGKDTVTYSADDYGFFISLFHFIPETGIVDGLERMWTRHNREDYWTPELESSGMQPVYNKELNISSLIDGSPTQPDGVHGYVPRYAEYKFARPILGGDFMLKDSAYSQPLLDSYHLYRRMRSDGAVPPLNVDFVRLVKTSDSIEDNNYNRIFQMTSDSFDHFFINVQMSIGANRPMIGYAEGAMEFTHEDKDHASVQVPYGGMRL